MYRAISSINTRHVPDPRATANVNFDTASQVPHFSFGIPRGEASAMGPQGPPFASAVNGTNSYSNGVTTLDAPFAKEPPTLADVDLLRARWNDLVAP